MDWFKSVFNVLLLAVLVCAAWSATIHLMHIPGVEASNVAWAREQTGTLIGGLLGLLTGYQLGKDTKGKPPSEPNG